MTCPQDWPRALGIVAIQACPDERVCHVGYVLNDAKRVGADEFALPRAYDSPMSAKEAEAWRAACLGRGEGDGAQLATLVGMFKGIYHSMLVGSPRFFRANESCDWIVAIPPVPTEDDEVPAEPPATLVKPVFEAYGSNSALVDSSLVDSTEELLELGRGCACARSSYVRAKKLLVHRRGVRDEYGALGALVYGALGAAWQATADHAVRIWRQAVLDEAQVRERHVASPYRVAHRQLQLDPRGSRLWAMEQTQEDLNRTCGDDVLARVFGDVADYVRRHTGIWCPERSMMRHLFSQRDCAIVGAHIHQAVNEYFPRELERASQSLNWPEVTPPGGCDLARDGEGWDRSYHCPELESQIDAMSIRLVKLLAGLGIEANSANHDAYKIAEFIFGYLRRRCLEFEVDHDALRKDGRSRLWALWDHKGTK